MLVFIIPIRHPNSSISYARAGTLLEDTLRSVCNQTDQNFRVVVVCNKTPAISYEKRYVEFIEVDFASPSLIDLKNKNPSLFDINKDKAAKHIIGLQHARKHKPDYVMFMDGDDFVHHSISKIVNAHPNENGWYIDKSYLYLHGRHILAEKDNFPLHCGISNIVNTDLIHLPQNVSMSMSADELYDAFEESNYLLNVIGGHQGSFFFYKLQPFPIRASVWTIGSREDIVGHAGQIYSHEVRAIFMTPTIQKQFCIPLASTGTLYFDFISVFFLRFWRVVQKKFNRRKIILRLKTLKTLIYFVFSFFFALVYSKNSEFYIVGSEDGIFLEDNSRTLVKHLSHSGKKVICILNSNRSSNRNKSSYIVRRGSFKSFLLFFRSSGVFYSHGISDVLPNLHFLPFLSILPKPPIVFMQHGVIGLKINQRFKHYLARQERWFDFITTTTKNECAIISELGIKKDKISLTGLPRYDRYNQFPVKENKILIFLTWSHDVDEYESKIKQIKNALKDSEIVKKGFSYEFADHPMMYTENYVRKRPRVTEKLSCYKLLITDQSSMAWDFIYFGSHVIFYQPESEFHLSHYEIIKKHSVSNPQELGGKLHSFADGKLDLICADFCHKDQKQSERVFKLIQ